jgi:hypothetical protein
MGHIAGEACVSCFCAVEVCCEAVPMMLAAKQNATPKIVFIVVSPVFVCRESALQEEISERDFSGELRQTPPTIAPVCRGEF